MLRRAGPFLLLTAAVWAAYVATVVLFNLLLHGRAVSESTLFPVAFTLAVLLLLDPVRRRAQGMVDAAFSRVRYDAAEALAAAGAELASALTRDQVAEVVCRAVDRAIPNAGAQLLVGGAERPAGDAGSAGLAVFQADVAVPILLRAQQVGLLTAGAKRCGLPYGAVDVQFLRALARQAAIALQNAAAYEELAALNTGLEQRVAERTAQLELANRELAQAYTELEAAQGELVHSERMAALGRLVAGVAHEINNPVSFIATSVAPLQRRLAQAAGGAPDDAAVLLREAQEIVAVMGRGAERTAAIVRDLRSFSRLGETARKPVDLHEGLDVAIRLLEPRWQRIAIHREYGSLPLVECDAGQINQVFMNVLAHACDAVGSGGALWIATRTTGEHVEVSVRADGAGSSLDGGTVRGLGLAISRNLVAAHGGRIEVEHAAGAGATFRVLLPLRPPAHLDNAPGANR